MYYLELPQSAAVVNDGHGNPRNLFTYHGPADLHTLSVEQIQSLILEPSHQDSPIGLSEAPFNVTNATVDDTIMDHITRAILKLSLATVEKEIFLQLCPNYTGKPHAAVENLTQTFLDGEGNVVTYSVAQYSSILQNASRTFAHYKKYPIDLCSLFIRGLHPDVRAFLAELYPDYNAPHDLNGRAQRTAFSKILRLAAVAEGRVQTNERMFARHTGQTYVTNVAAYPSQAEKTFGNYSKSPGGSNKEADKPAYRRFGKNHKCHGCDGPHPFSDCPDRDKPGVAERAKLSTSVA